jgi:hypothetical protein
MIRKKSLGWIFLILLFGIFIGSDLGEVLAYILPAGVVKDFFLRAAQFSLGPATLNLIVVTFTIGFSFKLNIISVLGVGITAYLLRWTQ